MKANNLSQFKKLAQVGTKIKGMRYQHHRPEGTDMFALYRSTVLPESTISQAISTGIAIDRDGVDSWFNWPKASDTSVYNNQLTVYNNTPDGQRVPMLTYEILPVNLQDSGK